MSYNQQYTLNTGNDSSGPVSQQFQDGTSAASGAAIRVSGAVMAAPHQLAFVPSQEENLSSLLPQQLQQSSSNYLIAPHQTQQMLQLQQQQLHPELVQKKVHSASIIYAPQQQVQQVATSSATIQIPPTISKSRKLQVDDALSYLEKVRQQFTNDPQVYNDFLEVMKEFKSHTIDTNGVIRRVSHLFRAYPDLIDGFNTFLPHGYEVRVHSNHIFIFEPNGNSSMINNASGELIDPKMDVPVTVSRQASPNAAALRQISVQQGHTFGKQDHHKIEPAIQPNNETIKMQQQRIDKVNSIQSVIEPGASSIDVQMSDQVQVQQNFILPGLEQTFIQQQSQQQQKESSQSGKPIHFNEALGYLNRIKERFANNPDVYREFLNILSNYQQWEGGQKWSEAEVYQRVSRLFHDELDLMRDFKSFLPDAKLDLSSEAKIGQAANFLEKEHEKDLARQQQEQQRVSVQNAKPAGNSVAHKRSNKEHTANSGTKKSRIQRNKVNYDVNMQEILNEISLKDFAIFEKIHRALESETIFENFIRTLMLYNKSLVSRSELMDLITPFLSGTPELLKQFKDILGGQTIIGTLPRKQQSLDERLPHDVAENIDYNTCKQHGVSYRSLPDDAKHPICSGRTPLCFEVLNDSYISFPKWSSEDSAPVSSKKYKGSSKRKGEKVSNPKRRSQFEELMYRTEDERFEVDIFIEVNSSAIAALEYARRKIEAMDPEDAKKFMEDPDFGCSPTFLTRAVRKLYGQHSAKVLLALKENPLVAVPQVLKRLREKDVECRALRKEYNVIWREQVERNYLKSLDHQAMTFKANDVKDIRSKGFIQQLETIYSENLKKAEDGREEEFEFGPQAVIEYPLDRQVFQDANELLMHYVRRQPNIPKKEKTKIKELLNTVIPKLFMLRMEVSTPDNEEIENSEKSEGESDAVKDDEKIREENFGLQQNIGRPRRGKHKQVQDNITSENVERKKASKNGNFATECYPPNSSKNSTKQSIDSYQIAYTMFFGSNSWILFIRLHAILCDRLAMIRKRTEELVDEYNAELVFRERQTKVYAEHGDSVESQLLNAVDTRLGLRDLKKPLQNPENFYQIMLQEMKNLLDGQIEASTFEDTLRSMFDTRAYILFTMDKLVNTLVRQLQNFVGDSASLDCIELFQKYFEKRINGGETGDIAAQADQEYSGAAEKLFLNQNCFKMFFFNRDRPFVSIELIDTEELDNQSEEEEESSNVMMLQDFEEFVQNNEESAFEPSFTVHKPIFLARNVKYRKKWAKFLRDQSLHNRQSPNKNSQLHTEMVDKFRFYLSVGFKQLLCSNENPLKALKDDIWEPINDVLILKEAPLVDRKAFRKSSVSRVKKFHNWLDKFHKDDNELSARWMTTGCTSRPCHHHEFKFLRFNTYSSKGSEE